MTTPTKEDVIKHLLQLRATLAHALKQHNISFARFNEIREQLLPLDVELGKLGATVDPLPQAAPTYVRPSRYERRRTKRAGKFTQRITAWAGNDSH